MNGRFILVLTTGILFFALRADVIDDQKCPCSKPPKSDILSIHRTTATDIDKCPCAKPPHKDDTEAKCPCGVKPRSDEEAKCPCGVKPRSDEEAKCPCGTKPRSDEEAKCPCAKPPHREIVARVCACMAGKPKPHRLEDFIDKCSCKPKPHKEPLTDGAADFIQATEAFTQIVTGGIIAHNTGDLKEGLSAIFTGINSLVDLTSRSAHPEEIYNQLYRFMASLDQQEMALLLAASKTAARTA